MSIVVNSIGKTDLLFWLQLFFLLLGTVLYTIEVIATVLYTIEVIATVLYTIEVIATVLYTIEVIAITMILPIAYSETYLSPTL